MQIKVNDDISPCVTKDNETGIGVVLIPGEYVNFTELGINGQRFVREHQWAFSDDAGSVEDATASPGKRRATKRAAASQ